MKTKAYKDLLKQRLAEESKRALKLVLQQWGKQKKVICLMNDILKDVPIKFWPKDKRDMEESIYIKQGPWRLVLTWNDTCGRPRRAADLQHKKYDHTAWVIEHSKIKGRFIDFDIGGS